MSSAKTQGDPSCPQQGSDPAIPAENSALELSRDSWSMWSTTSLPKNPTPCGEDTPCLHLSSRRAPRLVVPGNAPWPCQLCKQIPLTLLEWQDPGTGISHSLCQQTCQFPLLLTTAAPSLPTEIPWGQSQPATSAPCAPSHKKKHQVPTCAMDPVPRMGLEEGSRSRAELTPAHRGAQLVPEHGRAHTGATLEPGDTSVTTATPPGGEQLGAARAQGCSRMLCAGLGSATHHHGGNEESERGISFPPPPPPRMGWQGARAPNLHLSSPLWEPGPRLCLLWQVLHPPRAPQTGRSSLEQGGL